MFKIVLGTIIIVINLLLPFCFYLLIKKHKNLKKSFRAYFNEYEIFCILLSGYLVYREIVSEETLQLRLVYTLLFMVIFVIYKEWIQYLTIIRLSLQRFTKRELLWHIIHQLIFILFCGVIGMLLIVNILKPLSFNFNALIYFLISAVLFPILYPYLLLSLSGSSYFDENLKRNLAAFIKSYHFNHISLHATLTILPKWILCVGNGVFYKKIIISDYALEKFTELELKATITKQLGSFKEKYQLKTYLSLLIGIIVEFFLVFIMGPIRLIYLLLIFMLYVFIVASKVSTFYEYKSLQRALSFGMALETYETMICKKAKYNGVEIGLRTLRQIESLKNKEK